MTLVHPLPDALVEHIAQRFRVLGEPTRIRLLDRLREGEASVQELTAALGTTQQNASKHLGVLHAAGIVSRRREGNRVLYSAADEGVFALCETVCGDLRRQVADLEALLERAAG
ncbi:MAG TPA: metalloregulator ArsR/SmtB family transcription factor [Gaiellaceae bacterium]|nr:metalloregulator ArsR/SmtB family transcription factor [Gaiellaceae bacterium]